MEGEAIYLSGKKHWKLKKTTRMIGSGLLAVLMLVSIVAINAPSVKERGYAMSAAEDYEADELSSTDDLESTDAAGAVDAVADGDAGAAGAEDAVADGDAEAAEEDAVAEDAPEADAEAVLGKHIRAKETGHNFLTAGRFSKC